MGTETNPAIDRDVPLYGERNPYSTGSAVALEVDTVAPWLVTIDAPHHQIHEDEAFSHDFNVSAATTASGAQVFLTGSGVTHFRITGIASTADKLWIRFYQSQSASGISSASGYSASAVSTNRNRNAATESSNVHWLTASGAVTIASGTLLDMHLIGGGTGTGGSKSGGTSAPDEEWVLKPSTVYAIHYYNQSTGDNIFNIRTFEYTETS